MLPYIHAKSFTGFSAQHKIAVHLTVDINIYLCIFVTIELINKVMKSDISFILCFNKQ